MKMLNLEHIEEFLQVGGFNERIYLHFMPDDCKLGALILVPLTGVEVDHYLPNYYKGDIQVIVRAPTQAEGDELSQIVINALTTQRPVSLPAGGPEAMLIKHMLPKSLPIRYPRSEDSKSIEWSINFDCCFVLVS